MFNEQKIAIMTSVVTFGVVLWMFAVGKSMKRIMVFLYLIFFIGGLAVNWWKMYQVDMKKTNPDGISFPLRLLVVMT